MIRELILDDMNYEGTDSSGKKSAIRHLVYSCDKGDSTMILADSNLIPNIGDVHPVYTSWVVESVDKPKYSEGKPEFHFTVKYSSGGNGGNGGSEKGANVPPWELGPQNVKTSALPIEMPIRQLYNPDAKKWKSFRNTAGNRLLRTGKFYAVQLSFTMNYKHRTGKWQEALLRQSINDSALTVCNLSVKRHRGRMMPFTPTLHTVYENDGKTIKWQYETVDYTIDILPGDIDYSWMVSELNVGRLARFERNGKLSNPEPIYCYTPWTNESDLDNMKISATYGGISEVQKAQAVYEKVVPGKKIPWSQVDEQMPLDDDGTLLLSALEPGKTDEEDYLRIEGFEMVPESWNKYNLPRSI